MSGVPAIDEVVDRITSDFGEGGRPPTDGFRLADARAADGGLEIAFDWRRDPQRYLLHLPYPSWFAAPLGDAFDAGDAVGELALWLMEELDTGFVGRADRRRVGDTVLLVERRHQHSGWFVGRVPLEHSPRAAQRAREAMASSGEAFAVVADEEPREPIADPGRFLDRAGLDGTEGRAAARDGSLLTWLQVDRGEGGSPRAGQVVVVRVEPSTARIVRLQLATPDPEALADLVMAACRDAIESGAEVLLAPRDLRELLPFGFIEVDDVLSARHDEVHRPDGRPAARP